MNTKYVRCEYQLKCIVDFCGNFYLVIGKNLSMVKTIRFSYFLTIQNLGYMDLKQIPKYSVDAYKKSCHCLFIIAKAMYLTQNNGSLKHYKFICTMLLVSLKQD